MPYNVSDWETAPAGKFGTERERPTHQSVLQVDCETIDHFTTTFGNSKPFGMSARLSLMILRFIPTQPWS